jgi:hypothetical protein
LDNKKRQSDKSGTLDSTMPSAKKKPMGRKEAKEKLRGGRGSSKPHFGKIKIEGREIKEQDVTIGPLFRLDIFLICTK